MNITLTNRHTGEELSPATPIVFEESGKIFIDPEILEAEGEDVIFKAFDYWRDEEMLGKAVTIATMTAEEALRVAKSTGKYRVRVNRKLFTHDRRGSFCAGFVKQRGSTTWLLPVSDADAIGLMEGKKKITYYTYNRGAQVVDA